MSQEELEKAMKAYVETPYVTPPAIEPLLALLRERGHVLVGPVRGQSRDPWKIDGVSMLLETSTTSEHSYAHRGKRYIQIGGGYGYGRAQTYREQADGQFPWVKMADRVKARVEEGKHEAARATEDRVKRNAAQAVIDQALRDHPRLAGKVRIEAYHDGFKLSIAQSVDANTLTYLMNVLEPMASALPAPPVFSWGATENVEEDDEAAP